MLVQLLLAVPPSSLRLTKLDAEIYSQFRSQFPDLNVNALDVERIKSTDGKEVIITIRVGHV